MVIMRRWIDASGRPGSPIHHRVSSFTSTLVRTNVLHSAFDSSDMFEAPYPPYDPTDPKGFSYTTVVHRWPVIITGVIDRMHRLSHDLCLEMNAEQSEPKKESFKLRIDEAKGIIEKASEISRLKYEMGRNYIMEPIPADGESNEMYNSELERLAADAKNTWFTAPWLFAECYLYRLLRSYFAQTTQWCSFDPFASQKIDTFKQSAKAIYQIATTMHQLQEEHAKLESDPEKLGVLFKEMIQMCLWGNATDLSLLTHMSASDIEHLQTVGKDAQAARAEFILRDDQEKVWNHVKSLSNGKVDFVLDNAGFELFTDFVLADFLVTYTPYVSTVIFHPKLIPWFVSDVTPDDFANSIAPVLDREFLPPPPGMDFEHLRTMLKRWEKYIADGIFALSVPTTTPLGGGSDGAAQLAEFWDLPGALLEYAIPCSQSLECARSQQSRYFQRRFEVITASSLTGDVQWPAWTPFSTALGPLAGSFPILSLRTNKADVVVGVEREIAEKLDESGSKWRVDGR
ncbi:DUF89 domain-containing protein [Mycena sanguinolenta]|uniref:Sugar phosphate phosphatase n=1 Tax=Mycena sanguinolenta TaxID=230812 RepID=A0A8H7DGD7_9AGAR|nr:DUF89 domain-containing protein [Mycena sanguinolenta]